MRCLPTLSLLVFTWSASFGQEEPWSLASTNAERSQQAVRFCRRYANGWLAHADPVTGLLPRRVDGDFFWNAKDCAADNFPFLALTALVLDDHHLKRAATHLFEQERALTPRLDSLPDDWDFRTQAFRTEAYDLDALIFGASEYAKDGLMPLIEWAGREPWSTRLEEMLRDVYVHAPFQTKTGARLPSTNVEVCGELMQTLSRLAWRDEEPWQTWAFDLADEWLLERDLLGDAYLKLRDHGCEILGGLGEVYHLASVRDPERRERYRPRMHRLLDRVLEVGRNEHGLFWNAVNPQTGAVVSKGLSDGWGYVFDAFLIVAHVDSVTRYEHAVREAMRGVTHYEQYDWEGRQGADGYADSIEGAINLQARLHVPETDAWIHAEIQHIFAKQREDGILEGWYGDGNSARTALMYALLTTQGIAAAPWRDDVRLGAEPDGEGGVRVTVESEWPWEGVLRFDAPRHADALEHAVGCAAHQPIPRVVRHAGRRDLPCAVGRQGATRNEGFLVARSAGQVEREAAQAFQCASPARG
ncbi:MAG: hypothetical protein H6834_08745 [Planctomycetes bacterium]|nr:hypothetical protein [Planctomycetota bacterium]